MLVTVSLYVSPPMQIRDTKYAHQLQNEIHSSDSTKDEYVLTMVFAYNVNYNVFSGMSVINYKGRLG